MGIGITKLNHVNVTVPAELEEAAKRFYCPLLGLRKFPNQRERGREWALGISSARVRFTYRLKRMLIGGKRSPRLLSGI